MAAARRARRCGLNTPRVHSLARRCDRLRREEPVVRLGRVDHQGLDHKVGPICGLEVAEAERRLADYSRDRRDELAVFPRPLDLLLKPHSGVLLPPAVAPRNRDLLARPFVDFHQVVVELVKFGLIRIREQAFRLLSVRVEELKDESLAGLVPHLLRPHLHPAGLRLDMEVHAHVLGLDVVVVDPPDLQADPSVQSSHG